MKQGDAPLNMRARVVVALRIGLMQNAKDKEEDASLDET
jgi:hypothetical protein